MEKLISFENQGQRLFGMTHSPDTNRRAPAVLMCHGFTGDRVESHFIFVKMARRLADAGFFVMRFDFRGSGESEGDFSDMTIPAEIDDARVALAWLRGQPEVDPKRVSLLGLSMGGAVATSLAGEDEDIAGLILWSALARPSMFVSQEVARAGKTPPPLSVQKDGNFDMGGNLVGKAFKETAQEVQPLKNIQKYAGDVLILHGTRDETVPPSEAKRYADAVGEKRASLHWIQDADHTYNAHIWEQEVFKLTLEWLSKRMILKGQQAQ